MMQVVVAKSRFLAPLEPCHHPSFPLSLNKPQPEYLSGESSLNILLIDNRFIPFTARLDAQIQV